MITEFQYKMLEKAYNFYNQKLFGGELTPCLITFHKSRTSTGGTYCKITYDRKETDGQEKIPEIELNPVHFKNTKDERILSVLVHEMCHHWDHSFNTPTAGWHGKTWADKMEKIGLMPSSTGRKNGKKTGASMNHYIIPGGGFEVWTKDFLRKHGSVFLVEPSDAWFENKAKTASRESKTKYTCPACGQNAWAKPDAFLICGFDNETMKKG